MMNEGASISVVIRTKNSANTLTMVIARLGLTNADELIIVDSGSLDSTLEIAKATGARILDVSREPFSYSRSLNAGFAVARYDWVLSLSSHCIPVEPNLLSQYRSLLSTLAPEIGAIVGGIVASIADVKNNSQPQICAPVDFFQGQYFTCANPNCLYRKEFWIKHPFDEQIERNEDLEWSLWAYRNGISLMRHNAVSVLYRSRLNFLQMFKKGYLDARVAKRMVPNPPFTWCRFFKEIFWTLVNVLRGQLPPGFAVKRICYFVGDFLGRRSQ